MARLRWRLFFESVWSGEVTQLLEAPMPKHLTGQDRITFAKNKQRANELLVTLFPADEDSNGK